MRRFQKRISKVLRKLNNFYLVYGLLILIPGLILAILKGNFKLVGLSVSVVAVLFILHLVYLDKRFSLKKISIWLLAVIAISYFPVFIDLLHDYNSLRTFKENIRISVINQFCNNSFYAIPFAILIAGYVDFLYNIGVRKSDSAVHFGTLICMVIIIGLTFFDVCPDKNWYSGQITFDRFTLLFISEFVIVYAIIIFSLYLKGRSEGPT